MYHHIINKCEQKNSKKNSKFIVNFSYQIPYNNKNNKNMITSIDNLIKKL